MRVQMKHGAFAGDLHLRLHLFFSCSDLETIT